MEFEIEELDDKNFFQEIARTDYPVFVDFWAAWCPPCRMMEPVIEELAEEFKEKLLVRKLNTDLYHTIAGQFGISGIPTFIIFKNGKEVWRNIGALGKKNLVQMCEDAIK